MNKILSKKSLLILLSSIIISACGGGGGGGGGDTGGGDGGSTPAPTVTLSSSVSSAQTNTEFTLTWSSTNATACTASGDWSVSIGTSGTQTISESTSGSKTYTITCTGAGGSVSDSVTVNITDPASPTATLIANVSSVIVNNSFTLTWSSTNATACTASGDWSVSIGTSGTQSITETETGVKTYTITCTGAGGSATDTATVTIDAAQSDTAFNGFAIDGYISGANIFIDQNFNFKQDDGEYTAVTNTDGSFTIETNDTAIFNCLKKRPIVADVPVGAVDSTLGGVTEAYQMILPSVEDAGTNTIVISPFTSLFAEAIITGKKNLVDDLTVAEGCQSAGDDVANNISERINELKTSIENSFGITYAELLSDFIVTPGTSVNESAARNIAKLLPPLKIIDNQVSQYLSQTLNKEIRANVSLSEDSLNLIFNGEIFEELPLNFYSSYSTEPNSEGWYRNESLEATGAFITDSGRLKREDCSDTDTTLCGIAELTLKNIANASTNFRRTSSFNKNTSVDFNDLGITEGSLSVSASLSSSWRDGSVNWNASGSRARECQKVEEIQFQNEVSSKISTNFHYNNYSQGFEKADCDDVRHYYTPILNASTFLNDGSGTGLGAQYYIFDILRSGISSNLPYDFIGDSVNINPELIVQDVASLPRMFKDLDAIRSLFTGDDYILFSYDKESSLNAYFEAGTNPSNDMFWDLSSGFSNAPDRIYGQDARTEFFNRLRQNSNLDENFYGANAPQNTSIIGRIANSYIEISEYSGAEEIKLQVTPTYDYTNKVLNYSLTSSLDLENIQDFIENGIDGNPLNTKIWFNPDGSIDTTVPVKLSLIEGADNLVDSGERYFTISFELEVTSNSDGNDNNYAATQTWSLPADSSIQVSYTENLVTVSKNIVNKDFDQITLQDSNTGEQSNQLDNFITQPANLDLKILNLLSKVSDEIADIKSFFVDGGTYTVELDLKSGGHSIVGFNRNLVEKITGTFVTKSSPEYSISVNDIILREGDNKDICFMRPSQGTLTATNLNLSFEQRERPGKGGLQDDFTLSSSEVIFQEGDTESCITFNASLDTHFDWAHDIYLDISNPSNGQSLSRSRVKATILDNFFPNRIDWRRK
tara:strand:+ start:349 stop:3675 length:3327 start_codon:yes stop_codon:yes gene_type:complete